MCTREDFFGSGYIPPEGSYNNNDDDDDENASIPTRDPDSLAERIRRHPVDQGRHRVISNTRFPPLYE